MFGDVQWKLDFVKQLYCQPQYSLFRFEFGRLIALKFTASHKQWGGNSPVDIPCPDNKLGIVFSFLC
jgi:hypothetical protein